MEGPVPARPAEPGQIGQIIDCDVHVSVPGTEALLPYLGEHWRETVVSRGIDGLDLVSYPPSAPLSCRPDWRRQGMKPGASFDDLVAQVLEAQGASYAICNCLYGAQVMMSEDLGAALCRAVNRWLAAEWLDRDSRLRASIVVPMQNAALAAEEIDFWAADPRFVQVLLLGMGEMMLGRRYYWPVYEAAARHGLPLAIHAGSAYRYAPTASGWPAHLASDYVVQGHGLEMQLLSLIGEGVLSKFPDLKVVLLESGVTWLPPFLWRADKTWRALRSEVPWLTCPPSRLVRESVRFTIQPFDAPMERAALERMLAQLGSAELLLYASDYPHWQFDGPDPMHPVLAEALQDDLARVQSTNALSLYPRLKEAAA